MNSIWYNLLHLSRQRFLHLQRHLVITRSMANLARLGVRSGVMDTIWELVFDACGSFTLNGFGD